MVSKCKHTKEDDQQTNARQYPFLALLFHIHKNTNAALTASKHNTSTCLLQETCSFYLHNTLMHKCPKRCQSHGIFGKSSALNDSLCFQRKFKGGPYSNAAIKLLIQPSELIKKHAHKCPIPDACHLHEKMLQTQSLLRGDHTLTRPQEKHSKLCVSLSTFCLICLDVQTDAMKPHQSYPWTIGSIQSAIANVIPTLWPSFLPPSHAFLWIMSVHSSQSPYS